LKQLEVRCSYSQVRPVSAPLIYIVNLIDFVEEHMWVTFSSSTESSPGLYKINNWTFESYGIGQSSLGGYNLGIIIGSALNVPSMILLAIICIASSVWQKHGGGK
jgi:hypothetical protein